MSQLERLYDTLQALSQETLIQIIDELELEIPDNQYKEMAEDVYFKGKHGIPLTYKQKRVLVNIIGR